MKFPSTNGAGANPKRPLEREGSGISVSPVTADDFSFCGVARWVLLGEAKDTIECGYTDCTFKECASALFRVGDNARCVFLNRMEGNCGIIGALTSMEGAIKWEAGLASKGETTEDGFGLNRTGPGAPACPA